MKLPIPTAPLTTRPSRTEARSEATTRLARQIIDTEAAAREAKTARLRAARLAAEPDEEEAVAPAPKKRKAAAPKAPKAAAKKPAKAAKVSRH